MSYIVYWIRTANHTNMSCEGYIGVTKNFNRAGFKQVANGYSKTTHGGWTIAVSK